MDQQAPLANPIAAYLEAEGIRAIELARRLRTSKGAVSEMINGKRQISIKMARRLEGLTGRPWHEFVSPPDERVAAE